MASDVVKEHCKFFLVDLLDGDDFESERLRVTVNCPGVDKFLYRFGQFQRESIFVETNHSGLRGYSRGSAGAIA